MTKYFTNNYPMVNLHKKPQKKSEIVTQMIYGDTFSVLKKNNNWLKVKIREDKYKGYIQNKSFPYFFKPTHKVHVLKANVYKFNRKKLKINQLPFCSKIKVDGAKGKFFKFSNGWIRKKDVKKISFKEKNIFKKIVMFKNVKYKWGGKSFKGIDCSALIQIFLNFNNQFCPRDTKDQEKYFKKNIKKEHIKKNDIIYWKGHVALALSNKKLIHAYGPMKKTVIMDIDKTIERIERTAKLGVKKVSRL